MSGIDTGWSVPSRRYVELSMALSIRQNTTSLRALLKHSLLRELIASSNLTQMSINASKGCPTFFIAETVSIDHANKPTVSYKRLYAWPWP
jgi:hypothetical protein